MAAVRILRPGFSGCFATQIFQKGETVLRLQGPLLAQPTRESIQIGPDLHVVDPTGSFINHSNTPSAMVDQQRQCIVTIRPVAIDDEITFDYNANETTMACPFITEDGTAVGGISPAVPSSLDPADPSN